LLVSSVESIEIPHPHVLLDHTHAAAHVLVMLAGEIVEDGRTYGAGDVRLSAAGDRHFLRFTSATSASPSQRRSAPVVAAKPSTC